MHTDYTVQLQREAERKAGRGKKRGAELRRREFEGSVERHRGTNGDEKLVYRTGAKSRQRAADAAAAADGGPGLWAGQRRRPSVSFLGALSGLFYFCATAAVTAIPERG